MPTNGKGALEQEDNVFYYFIIFFISVYIALLGFTRHFFLLLIDLFYFKMVRLVCPEA